MNQAHLQLYNHDWLYEEYVIKKRSLQSIGKDVGVTKHSIRRALKRFGIQPRKHTSRYPQLNDKEWLERKFIKESMTVSGIATLIGSTPGNVHSALSTIGLIDNNGNSKLNTKADLGRLEDRKWLESEIENKTLRSIASEIGVSYSKVQTTFRKLNIKIPERRKYQYTPESRERKSESVRRGLKIRFPQGRFGESHPRWKGGLPLCIDCGAVTSRRDAIRCFKCERSDNRKGDNNTNWRGGATKLNNAIRSSKLNKLWRKSVYERDNYTCQMIDCNVVGGPGTGIIMHADHIKPFVLVVHENNICTLSDALSCYELWDINNGRTLCGDCHRKTDTYAKRLNNFL